VTFCEDCRQEYETVKYGRICPYCRSEYTYLVQGNECTIKEIEAETEEDG
jgi:hydrogenase nickel incorporation protein HypA/HybF